MDRGVRTESCFFSYLLLGAEAAAAEPGNSRDCQR